MCVKVGAQIRGIRFGYEVYFYFHSPDCIAQLWVLGNHAGNGAVLPQWVRGGLCAAACIGALGRAALGEKPWQAMGPALCKGKCGRDIVRQRRDI